MTILADQFPIGRMDSVVFILLVLLEPGCSGDKPITHIEIKTRRHNRRCSIDVREQGKETTIEEHIGAQSQSSEGEARTVEPVARVTKDPGMKRFLGTRRSNNHYEGFLCGGKYVVILVGNLDLGIN